MNNAKPTGALIAPLLVLGLGLCALLLNPDGLADALRHGLWAAWAAHAPAIIPRRPPLALAGECVTLLLTGGFTLLLLLRAPFYWAGLFTAAALCALFQAGWLLFSTQGWTIDAAGPSLGLLLVLAAGIWARARQIAILRTDLRLAFADSLPRATIERIARRPSLLTQAGETRNVTYLVCGVRGLAGLAASYRDDPRAFTSLMQQVLTPLLDQVLAHGGTIDRLTADGFAAFWNAPLDDSDHATHACEAANGMAITAARVTEMIAEAHRPGAEKMPPVEIGVGIATGPVIAGGFGGHGRMGYSVNGDAVALAGRIQSLSGQYGPAVIVAEDTATAAQRGFAFLEVDYIAAGKEDDPVRLYAMLGNPVVRSSPKFRALIAFHEHIFNSLRTQQWGKARELIEQCRKLSGASQRLYELHLTRIRYFEANPPGANWDGAFRPILK